MFWWGSKNKFLNLGSLGMRPCSTCEKDRMFSLMLAYRLYHLWTLFRWITGKTYSVVCDTCGHGYKADVAEVEAASDKHPVPWFDRFGWAIGVGLIAVIVVFGVVSDRQNQNEDDAYIAAPHVGDLYIVDFARIVDKPDAPVMYGTMRVTAVTGRDVTFQLSKTYFAKLKGVNRDVNSGDVYEAIYYGNETIVIPSYSLKELHDDGAIDDIERNKPI
jgi:hypothetical protein